MSSQEKWYKITLSDKQFASGKVFDIPKEFENLFIAAQTPSDMAMFGEKSTVRKGDNFYFSPGSIKYIKPLLKKYNASPCKINKAELAFIVGDDSFK